MAGISSAEGSRWENPRRKSKRKPERRKISQGRSHFQTAGPPSLEEIPEVFFQNSEDKKNTLQTVYL